MIHKSTKGHYYPSEHEDVIEALRAYCSGKTFLDLGSGDGRVIEWAKECGAVDPHGIEFDDIATDIHGDLFEHDIHQYDVLFYYILGANNEQDLLNWIRLKFNGILLLNEGVATEAKDRYLLLQKEPVTTLGKTKVFNFN